MIILGIDPGIATTGYGVLQKEGQKLTALNINLNIVKTESTPTMTTHVGARLEDSLKLVEETVESIRDVMAELRPAGQMMSGSGSTLFALCRDRREAARIAREFRVGLPTDSGVRVFVVRSCV